MELIGCSHTSMNTPLTPPTTRLCHQVALGALCIPQMHCRQRNECALSDKIACIQRVVESRASIQYLLEDEDYLGALEVGSRAAMTHSRTPSHTPALQNVTYYMLFTTLSPLHPPPPLYSQVIHECRTMFAEEGLGGLSCVRGTGRQVTQHHPLHTNASTLAILTRPLTLTHSHMYQGHGTDRADDAGGLRVHVRGPDGEHKPTPTHPISYPLSHPLIHPLTHPLIHPILHPLTPLLVHVRRPNGENPVLT